MSGLSSKATRLAAGFLFLLLALVPVYLISEGVQNQAATNYERLINRSQLEIQHELIRFKLDLVPRNFVENLLRELEQKAGVVEEGRARAVIDKDRDPQIFDKLAYRRMLKILQDEYGLHPLMFAVYSADLYDINYIYSPAVSEYLSDWEKYKVTCALGNLITRSSDLDMVSGFSDARERYLMRTEDGRFGGKNFADDHRQVMRLIFGPLAFVPSENGNVYEMLSDRYGCSRIFVQGHGITDGRRFYGGYYLVIGNKDISPDLILKNSLRNFSKGVARSFEAVESEGYLVGSSEITAELKGYAKLFAEDYQLPEKIYVSCDLRVDAKYLANIRNGVVYTRLLAVLLLIIVVTKFYRQGFTGIRSLKSKMILLPLFAVMMPMSLLGYLSFSVMGKLESLRHDRSESEIQSQIYQLENYYQDQKTLRLLRFFTSKKSFVSIINLPFHELMSVDAHNIVEKGAFCNFYLYRNDGAKRSFLSHNSYELKNSSLINSIGARFLNNMGVLDTGKAIASKDLQRAGLTDGLLSELSFGYLENQTVVNESRETTDISRLSDHSRMVLQFIGESAHPLARVKGMGYVETVSRYNNVYSLEKFPESIYSSDGVLGGNRLAFGFRGNENTVMRWHPRYMHSSSDLKEFLDFAGRTQSTGMISRVESRDIIATAWKYDRDGFVTYSGIHRSHPDLRVELAAGLFPWFLLIFTLISIFLFIDVLETFFIGPVRVFIDGARRIGLGDLSARIVMARTDEISDLAQSFNSMVSGLQKREMLKRFVADDLLATVQKSGQLSQQNLDEVEVCVLASDIRGFTTLSEKHDAQKVVTLLNDYFTEMEGAITANGGVISRFIGDAVLAVFYEAEDAPGPVRAVRAAIGMRKALRELNRRRAAAGEFEVENGVGVAFGGAIAGIAGSRSGRQVVSVIGEPVRVAEELESLSRHSQFDRIVVDAKVMQQTEAIFKYAPLNGHSGVYDLSEVTDEQK